MKLIRFAYLWREKSIVVQYVPTEDISESEESVTPISTIHTVTLTSDDATVLPSELLSDEEWVRNTTNLMLLRRTSTAVSQEDKDKADNLVQHLATQFREHKNQKVLKARRNHWSMKLASKNLAASAAYMILSEHVKKDIARLNQEDSLLSGDMSKFHDCSLVPDHHGAYIYYDTNNEVFIRSGKVTNRGFRVRNDEHRLAAKNLTAKSRFYAMYPSKLSERAGVRGTRGIFENLIQVVGAGFVSTSSEAQNLNRDWKEGGFLILSDKEKDRISGSSAGKTQLEKFHNICPYQLELGYDLAISPVHNVSENPGFESFWGVISGYVK